MPGAPSTSGSASCWECRDEQSTVLPTAAHSSLGQTSSFTKNCTITWHPNKRGFQTKNNYKVSETMWASWKWRCGHPGLGTGYVFTCPWKHTLISASRLPVSSSAGPGPCGDMSISWGWGWIASALRDHTWEETECGTADKRQRTGLPLIDATIVLLRRPLSGQIFFVPFDRWER